VSYSASPVFGNSADDAGDAQNIGTTTIETSIDFMAVSSFKGRLAIYGQRCALK
jgi:hypothetical protein